MKTFADALAQAGLVSEDKVKSVKAKEAEKNKVDSELATYALKYSFLQRFLAEVESYGTFLADQYKEEFALLAAFGKNFKDYKEIQKQAEWHFSNISKKQSWQKDQMGSLLSSWFSDPLEMKWQIRALGYTFLDVLGEKRDRFSLSTKKNVLDFLNKYQIKELALNRS